MRLTLNDGTSITVEPIGTTTEGSPVLDEDTALTVVEAWSSADDVDEYRGWTTPDDDSAPQPFILAWIAPGSASSIGFEEWPVLYDPAAGFWDRSAYSLDTFPFELHLSAD